LRPLEEADLGSVMAIEEASFRSPWSLTLFREELGNPLSRCWVAEWAAAEPSSSTDLGEGRGVAGYLCVWFVVDEMHILNLATRPDLRRRGIARELLRSALSHAENSGMVRAVLEVRGSNRAAQSLYCSLGFRLAGRRPRYYSDTGEDAWVMIYDVEPGNERPLGNDSIPS
jgi:ribosomal-protein-alanine N-acetyltransferase